MKNIPAEIEAVFINIDKEAYRKRLLDAGAELVQKEKLMKRKVFDMGPNSFARVRDERNKITMSYKNLEEHSLSGMHEVCLEVNDYDAAVLFLESIGLKVKSEQESFREEWLLDGVEITIDTWPWLPTYTEIEGPSEEAVKKVAEKLGFSMDDAKYGSASDIYQIYYDIETKEIDYLPEIKFTDTPKWLEEKRRK